jgi:hypothetical protein
MSKLSKLDVLEEKIIEAAIAPNQDMTQRAITRYRRDVCLIVIKALREAEGETAADEAAAVGIGLSYAFAILLLISKDPPTAVKVFTESSLALNAGLKKCFWSES